MSYEYDIGVIDEASVLVECGPMRLVIQAWNRDEPQIGPARQAAAESISYLERIARHRSLLSRPWQQIEKYPQDELVRQMAISVRTVGDEDLTPMAAVAGTIADAVADWLYKNGMAKVIIDNGGDISVRLRAGETASVGIRPSVTSHHISHIVQLDTARNAWGVTTSGVGGRSFTKGIASAATVLAANASVADAASTAIANECFVDDSSIIQLPAEQIDPDSDLADSDVTLDAGPLSYEKTLEAITAAQQRADNLTQKGLIIGAFIALERQFVITDGLQPYIFEVGGTDG
jgi:ApbE superfamily uncharacterized protein (UPF0280 family)